MLTVLWTQIAQAGRLILGFSSRLLLFWVPWCDLADACRCNQDDQGDTVKGMDYDGEECDSAANGTVVGYWHVPIAIV